MANLNENFLFFFSPAMLADTRVQLIVPSFSALFPSPSIELGPNESPMADSKLFHKAYHQFILEH